MSVSQIFQLVAQALANLVIFKLTQILDVI